MVELIWDGKYDANGRRVAPPRLKLPFQTVETVNESAQQRQMAFDLFNSGRPAEWRNRLIWGDKKYVLPALLDEFAGQVDLIYIDPPFATGADFSFTAQVGDEVFTKEPSIIEQKAYRDTWGRGLDSYLQWFSETIAMLCDLLSKNGSLYVHLDANAVHYAKVVIDEIFERDKFRNSISWKRTSARSDADSWGNIHDTLLFYSKGDDYTWNSVFQAYDEQYVQSKYTYTDERGRYRTDNLTAAGLRSGDSGKNWRGIDPAKIGGHWKVNREAVELLVGREKSDRMTTQEKLDLLDANNYIYWPSRGKDGGSGTPQFKRYIKEGVAIQDIIVDIPPVNSQAQERINYPTQKPEALLDRILKASSNENDLVLDCFCGSGTTAAVAEKLNRRWITCDLGRFAIHTARKRLLSIPNLKPFVVQNLGKYERQAWQVAEFGDSEQAAAINARYRRFLLDLYNARPIDGYLWLHGVKGGRMVHVGPVDSPISPSDITQIAIEFRKAMGTGKDAPSISAVDVLGWDFAFELNEVARQQAEQANIKLRFVRIPREVLEQKAVEQGDIKFFELAALAVAVAQNKRSLTLTLSDFVIPPDDVPDDVQKAISHWSQWIDYWAVDWDNQGDTFHNQWQTYRTRQSKSLQLQTSHSYDAAGDYRIMVKVIDILGNDTTKTLRVHVP
jgi:DNA modification methylase